MDAMSAPYVALGDSVAAGVGAGERTGPCWRTDAGFPLDVAQALGVELAWQACIGATVPDVLAGQVEALTEDTRWVTITVGANDIGFAPVLVTAAQPAWMSESDTVIDAALHRLRTDLPGLLDTLYADVRARAPHAEVLVTTYPRLFNGEDCSLVTFFDDDEMARLNAAADELALCLRDAADRAGFTCVDVLPRFIGHAACDDDEWINGVSWPVEESFHPNADGHAAYARAVERAWSTGRPRRERVGVHHGARSGSAPTFSVPDLLGMASLEGAARFGLDPDEVAQLARTLDVDAEAGPRLHQLHREVRALRRTGL